MCERVCMYYSMYRNALKTGYTSHVGLYAIVCERSLELAPKRIIMAF